MQADSAKRPQARALVVKLLSDLKATEAGPIKSAFKLAASQQSQAAASKAAGETWGSHSREKLTQAWGAALAETALGLQSSSEIGQVVETDKGVHLVKLQSRRSGRGSRKSLSIPISHDITHTHNCRHSPATLKQHRHKSEPTLPHSPETLLHGPSLKSLSKCKHLAPLIQLL
ncbi:peptidylprolyl isomerase [Myxococcus sp. CA039A]|uniref:peptidylprolyl isomerase n=1 Tax=Myxococcus sp. CA039A TaxID=2741737 RepID=UPI002111C214|nr:peptidylprolyl isomerase [Myxococcus sp. CA039A]